MSLDWLTGDLIVHQCGHEVLQRNSKLIDDSLVGSFVKLFFQQNVHFQDLLISVRQVVLAAACA
jgi:hypothetical protein